MRIEENQTRTSKGKLNWKKHTKNPIASVTGFSSSKNEAAYYDRKKKKQITQLPNKT